jgi:hypothetical protein
MTTFIRYRDESFRKRPSRSASFDGTEADLRRLFRDGHPDLLDVTTIEEMMITRNHVIMTTFRLTGGASCGFKGQVLNKEQDVSELHSRLPLQPLDLPIMVVRTRQGFASLKSVPMLFGRGKCG